MDTWDIRIHVMESTACVDVCADGTMLLRMATNMAKTLVYVQLRVGTVGRPSRYWWKSVLSFRPPKGASESEISAVFDRMCLVTSARFGYEYRMAPARFGDDGLKKGFLL